MSDTQSLPSKALVWSTFAGALIAAVGAGLLFVAFDPELHLDPEGFAVFAPIYVAAQAIERLLEPLASRYNPAEKEKAELKEAREEKLKVEQKLAASLTTADIDTQQVAQELETKVTEEKAKAAALDKKRAERKLIFFLVATVLSCALAGVLGLGLYEAMSSETLETYLGAIDVGVTGLVIGAGTKPLHDLIARLEKAKENADSSDKPTAAVPAATSPG